MADDASGTDDRDRTSDSSATDSDDWDLTGSEDRRGSDDRFGSVARDDDPREEGYRIPLDLSEGNGDETDDVDAADADADDAYAPEPSSTPIEPGDPDLEHVIFVFLGAVAMVLVLFRLLSLPL
ncbi:DUF7312 domain-containing protein [Haloterrigena alkaliphila]|uniref:DUF7312 domain-containing protein n=1 Tax=Haloterrigena alkaliphila TaxID=2816475 RepID=A0A8A2VB83_9EURY|nr:hypothetical protein [Haloterrigena alkaliphila]QSW97977.1 hypothetical protein J0X25_11175 [Haloterrigena alkaliphila]